MGMTRKFWTMSRLSLGLGITLGLGACSGGSDGGTVYLVSGSPSTAASPAPARDTTPMPTSKFNDEVSEPMVVSANAASTAETNDEPRPIR